MRSLILVIGFVTAVYCIHGIRENTYQIQGVEVEELELDEDNKTKHSSHTRRRRQTAVAQPVSPGNQHARILRHFTNQQPQYFVPQQTLAPQAPQALLQRPLQPQQPQLQPQFQRLPTNGIQTNQISQFQQQAGARNPGQLQYIPDQVAPQPRRPVPKKQTNYYYPPRRPLPLPKCFHNPTGYVCCNEQLNDLMVDTYTVLETRPKFHACNIQLIATHLQMNAQKHFNTSFETVVGYEDFAQKIQFRGDMVCKVELGSRFMLAYATATDAYNHDINGQRREKRETNGDFEWGSSTDSSWDSIHQSFF